MLSAEDNETLTRIGAGTPMGEMIRRFWIPVFLAEELKERDGAPLRLRLMGEDLVAFRATDGRVGLLEENCPHRLASLVLAVNEDNALRCLYHGYKFAIDGTCLETPTEPASSKFHTRIRAVSYPTHEAGGVIWAYMGPAESQPAFPNYEWLSLPAAQCVPFKLLEDCNCAQGMEGTIDSAHAGILHKPRPWGAPAQLSFEVDLAPKIKIEFTRYGMRYAGLRKVADDKTTARVTQVILPAMALIPPDPRGKLPTRRLVNSFTPRDDHSTWNIQWLYDHTNPIDVAYRVDEGGHWVDANYRKLRNIDNWYQQDRQLMKTEMMSGIQGIVTQDHAVCESQGRITNRTKEHLGTSDAAVVAWRRQMIRAARALAQTGEAPAALASDLPWDTIKSATVEIPAGRSWKETLPLGKEVASVAA